MGSHRPYKEQKYLVGRRLLALRIQAGLTQVELARTLGVSKRSIIKWEGGEAYPSETHLRQLVELFVIRGAFTPRHERDEAEALWAQMSVDAGKRLGLFNEHWFAHLLVQNDEPRTTDNELGQAAPDAQPTSFIVHPSSFVDWAEAIDVPALYGREAELETLLQWVLIDRCRVVALLGLGGIGKTSLAIAFAHQMAIGFDTVVFRSLRNAPLLGPLLDTLIPIVSAQQATSPERVPDKIARLVELLRTRRCLLVLDNLEAIMQAGAPIGDYRAGYADYGDLIGRLGETQHQGCLLLTSRERPRELGPLEGRTAPVRTLPIGGLPENACRTILEEKDVSSSDVDIAALAQLYGGNPLALKLVSEPIREVFGGDVGAFLATGDAFFNGVGKLLEQQFVRSAPVEQAVLHWLAIERELVPIETLVANLSGAASQREVLQALESLRRRMLIERGTGRPAFTLQPVILEYLTDRLVRQVCQEIVDTQPALLCSHTLVQATAKEYVRRSQERLIGQQLLEQLVAAVGAERMEQRLRALLGAWRRQPAAEQGSGPGNVVNLLRLLHGHLRGLDLTQLEIRQAYLREVEVHDTSLAGSHLVQPVLIEPFSGIMSIVFSNDSRSLAAGTSDGEVRIWRVADRTPLLSIQAHSGSVTALVFSADGRRLASGGFDGMIRFWDCTTGACLTTLTGHRGVVRSVAFSPDERFVASGSQDGTVRWWDAASGEPPRVLYAGTGWINSVTFSTDGRLASCHQDGTIRLWDVTRGSCPALLQGHTDGVLDVALSSDGQFAVSASADKTIRLWDVASGTCRAILQGHTATVMDVVLSSDGRVIVSGSEDATVRLWDVASGTCRAILQGHTGAVWGVASAPDGQLLASGSLDGTLRLWEMATGQLLTTLQGHIDTVYGVALAADQGLIANASVDHTVRLWETTSGRLVGVLQGHTGLIWGVAFTLDGRLVASASDDRTVRLWEVATGTCLAILQGHSHGVFSVALTLDGRRVASGSFDGIVRLWDVASSACVSIFQGHTDAAYGIALSLDGQFLVSASSDRTVRLWDVASGTCVAILQGHTDAVYGVALSTDGQLVASSSFDRTVRLWEVASGTCVAILQGHTDAVYGVAFSADGQLIASGSGDGTVRLWEVASGACVAILQGHTNAIFGVALSGDGRLLASGSFDGTVRLWKTNTGTTTHILRPDRPYERMDITGLTGVSQAQRAVLKALGALERSSPSALLNQQ